MTLSFDHATIGHVGTVNVTQEDKENGNCCQSSPCVWDIKYEICCLWWNVARVDYSGDTSTSYERPSPNGWGPPGPPYYKYKTETVGCGIVDTEDVSIKFYMVTETADVLLDEEFIDLVCTDCI